MATQNRQWIPIEEPITSYMDEAEMSNQKYFKLWHLMFRFMTECGLDAFYAIQSVKLPVLANLTVPLPANCLQVGKVGVFNEQGCVISLSNNNNLSTAFDLQPTRLSQTQDNSINTGLEGQGTVWYTIGMVHQ